MANLARSGSSSSSALARAFGGAAPARTSADGASDERVSAYNIATKQLPAAVWGHSLGFAAHGFSAALDKSALAERLKAVIPVKPSTLGLAVATAVAVFAPRRGIRRGAVTAIIGFLHAKLGPAAQSVPELVTSLANRTPPQA